MSVTPPDDRDRLAYRTIVWAKSCPWCLTGPCPYGSPGCPRMDYLWRFDDLGWIDFVGEMR